MVGVHIIMYNNKSRRYFEYKNKVCISNCIYIFIDIYIQIHTYCVSSNTNYLCTLAPYESAKKKKRSILGPKKSKKTTS